MKDLKSKNTDSFVAIFLCVSLFFMFIVGIIGASYRFLKNHTSVIETKVVYNGEKDYPLLNTIFNNSKKSTFIIAKMEWLKGKLTNSVSERFMFYYDLILLKKCIDKFLGFDMTSSQGGIDNSLSTDIVIPFDKEWLGWVMLGFENDLQTESVIDFGKLMKSEGRNFFVFENPEKYNSFFGYKNLSEENSTSVNTKLKKNGITLFDIEEYMKLNNIDYKAIFFKTDHHWKASSGLWGNILLCNFLNENYGYEIDTSIFDLDNYDVQILRNHYLGSLGYKVTELYTKKEDFEIITPKYDSDITVFNSAYAETRRGSIEETLYASHFLEEKNTSVAIDYAFYGYGDTAVIISHNNLLHDGSSLLIIKMSFADVQIPTLTQAVEDFYAIDLRHFTGSLMSFIHKHDPQTVVLAYPTRAFVEKLVPGYEKKYIFNFN